MSPTNDKVVALLSAGLDSSVALAMALEAGRRGALALTFDYGQRAARREAEHAERLASYFGIPHRLIELPWFRELEGGGGLLKSSSPLPRPRLEELSSEAYTRDSAKAVWVPNRNGTFLEIAASIAEDLEAAEVVVGFNREEAQTFPDNSSSYLAAINEALRFSTRSRVAVVSPTVHLDKGEVVAWAKARSFPFELLWSCYEGGEAMCGRCESCMRLKRALKREGVSSDDWFEHTDFVG